MASLAMIRTQGTAMKRALHITGGMSVLRICSPSLLSVAAASRRDGAMSDVRGDDNDDDDDGNDDNVSHGGGVSTALLHRIHTLYPDIKVVQISSTLISVTIRKVLVAFVAIRCYDGNEQQQQQQQQVGHVNVVSIAESISRHHHNENGVLWQQSQYAVFQHISSIAVGAAMYFGANAAVISPLDAFIKWLAAYNNLFSAPCVHCGHHLSRENDIDSSLPPVVRPLIEPRDPWHSMCASVDKEGSVVS